MTSIDLFGPSGYVFALALSALGSALGTGVAGMAVLGAWKKCYLENRTPPFILTAFVGAPLSQTIYGMILMNSLRGVSAESVDPRVTFFAGVFGGLAMGASSWMQGRAGASAADALVATGKGFGNYLMILGIIETVALFVMVFLMTAVK